MSQYTILNPELLLVIIITIITQNRVFCHALVSFMYMPRADDRTLSMYSMARATVAC
jgi:hypothetical protein